MRQNIFLGQRWKCQFIKFDFRYSGLFFLQHHGINKHTQHGGNNSTGYALHTFVGTDDRSQLMLAEHGTHKVSAAVGQERNQKRNCNQIAARGHGENPNNGGQQIRNNRAGKEAGGNHLNIHLDVVCHHLRKQQNPENQQPQHCHTPLCAVQTPQRDCKGHDRGIQHHSQMAHQASDIQ